MKKRSVRYTWTAEFLLLLVLVVIMCTVVTAKARRRLLYEYEQFTVQQQQKIGTELDHYFAQLSTQAVDLLSDNVVEEFAYLSVPQQPDNYSLYRIQCRLKDVSSAGITERVYIYFHNTDRAITNETVLSRTQCALALLGAESGEPLAQFDTLMQTPALNRLVVTDGTAGPAVLAVSSVPANGRQVRAVVVQQIASHRLRAILSSQSSLEQATTLLLDETGRAVCSVGDAVLAETIAAEYDLQAADSRFDAPDGKYWVYCTQLQATGWTVLTAAPMRIIESRCDWLWQSILLFMAGLAVLWLPASALIIRWNYRPLKQLAQYAELADNSPENEYEQLGRAFRTVQSDLLGLKQLQENQRGVLRREWLSNAIAYDIPLYSTVAEEFGRMLKLNVAQGWFLLYLLDTPAPADFLEELPETADCAAMLVEPRERPMLCLIGGSAEALQGFAQTAEERLRQNGVEWLRGRSLQGVAALHEEFLSLCRQMEGAALSSAGRGVDVLRLSSAGCEEVPALVFEGKGEQACALLTRAAGVGLDGKMVSTTLVRMFYTGFLMDLFNKVPEGPNCAEVQSAVVATARALQSTATRQEMQELLDTLLIAAAAKYEQPAEVPQSDLIDRCIACVREHFREHDFNVSRMADLLGVSVPYLSRYFKEHAGVNLLGYLNSVRIDYAKKLIVEEKLSVAAAADRAGFENINTFIRLFKKYVGDTPGNYSRQ